MWKHVRVDRNWITSMYTSWTPNLRWNVHHYFLSDKSVLLTHWGRVTHICVIKPIIIGSDNGLSPGRRQAIIWTNAGILLIGPLGTNFTEILIEIHTFSFKKMHLKMSSGKRRTFCLGLNVLTFRTTMDSVDPTALSTWWPFRVHIYRRGTHNSELSMSVRWLLHRWMISYVRYTCRNNMF